jgi:hypothetical protein
MKFKTKRKAWKGPSPKSNAIYLENYNKIFKRVVSKKKTYAEELEEICKKQDEATDEFAASLGLKAELNPQYWRAKRKTEENKK